MVPALRTARIERGDLLVDRPRRHRARPALTSPSRGRSAAHEADPVPGRTPPLWLACEEPRRRFRSVSIVVCHIRKVPLKRCRGRSRPKLRGKSIASRSGTRQSHELGSRPEWLRGRDEAFGGFRGWQAGPGETISLGPGPVAPRNVHQVEDAYETCVVFLLGWPGVGKRTVGSHLAELVDGVLVDNQLINISSSHAFPVGWEVHPSPGDLGTRRADP